MSAKCQERHSKTPTEILTLAVDFSRKLRSGVLLTGTPTVTVSPSGPTLDNKAVNTAAIDVNGNTCAIGEAVTFRVSGGTVDTDYEITVSCGTNGTPANTLEAVCTLEVRS